jgi:hypothetical protein
MAVTPLNPVSKALENLRTLISNSTWFQTWVGAADAAAAKNRILIGELGVNLVSAVLASNIATFSSREPHNFSIGQAIRVEQIVAPFTGDLVVASTPDELTFTAALVAANQDELQCQEGIALPCPKPFCALRESGDEALKMKTIGSSGASILSGKIDVFLVGIVASIYGNDSEGAKVTMTNESFGFFQALRQMSGTGDYMTLNDINILGEAAFVPMSRQSDNQKRFQEWEASFQVSWGLEG